MCELYEISAVKNENPGFCGVDSCTVLKKTYCWLLTAESCHVRVSLKILSWLDVLFVKFGFLYITFKVVDFPVVNCIV